MEVVILTQPPLAIKYPAHSACRFFPAAHDPQAGAPCRIHWVEDARTSAAMMSNTMRLGSRSECATGRMWIASKSPSEVPALHIRVTCRLVGSTDAADGRKVIHISRYVLQVRLGSTVAGCTRIAHRRHSRRSNVRQQCLRHTPCAVSFSDGTRPASRCPVPDTLSRGEPRVAVSVNFQGASPVDSSTPSIIAAWVARFQARELGRKPSVPAWVCVA